VVHKTNPGDTKACHSSLDDDELPPLDDEDEVGEVDGSATTGMENNTFASPQNKTPNSYCYYIYPSLPYHHNKMSQVALIQQIV
jgi:hypothetical protein